VSRRGGFTLVEVIVALVVAVAAMTLVAQGFTSGARASVGAQAATRAAFVAQRVIAGYESGERTAGQADSGKFDDEPDFPWEARSETREQNLVELVVAVTWRDRELDRRFEVRRLLRQRTQTP
jgi:prepilin-type N-terminal cleavage/methylation domain-containing protein